MARQQEAERGAELEKTSRRLYEGNYDKDANIAVPLREDLHPQIPAGQDKRYEENASKEEATSAYVIVQAFALISHLHPLRPAIAHHRRGLSVEAHVSTAPTPDATPKRAT